VFRGSIVNHVTLSVTNLERSRAFYQGLIGATILVNNAPNWYDMRIGDSMVDVAAGKVPSIAHFSVGVDPWPGPERALEAIQKRFPESEPRIQQNPVLGRPDTKATGPGVKATEVRAIYLKDPDGLTVQINHPRYQLF
jgi:catechol 2,3-dioxygenase-like lactoylglutathione lyase family enzyme